MALKYIGNGDALTVDQVPARDLTDAEVKEHGGETKLLASGLYERAKQSKTVTEPDKEGE